MDHLITPEDVQRFVLDKTGINISLPDAEAFRFGVEAYLLSKSKAAVTPPQPPYTIGPKSDSLSVNQRMVLCDFAKGRSHYKIYSVGDEWVGRVITPGLFVEHTSAIFIRKEMWKLQIHGPADEYLTTIFDETRELRPKECYPIEVYRKNIPRTVMSQLHSGKRYRIPKSPEIRALRPFQQVHMPDDAGCFSVLPAELHLSKSFFAKHDEDVSFWWSESQDLWILWTDWIKWVFDLRRRPEHVYNPTGRPYEKSRPMTVDELIREMPAGREDE